PSAAKPFAATAAVAFSLFTLVQFLANQFGFDRDGFRALVFSPADRRLILLGKNLASLPAAATLGALLLGLVCVWLRLPVGGAAVNLLFSAALATVTIIVYWKTLEPIGRLLYRRETKILGRVTTEVE